MKTCTKCGEAKPLSAFNKMSAAKDGHQFQCRSCCKPYARKYYKNPYGTTTKTQEQRKLGEKGLKRCSKCSEVKPLASFAKQTAGHQGVRPDCRECRKTPPTARSLARQAVQETGIKRCTKCGEEKPVSGFRVLKVNENGTPVYLASCRVCAGEAKRESRREWRKVPENRERYNRKQRLVRSRRRALERATAVDLFTPDELLASYVERGYTGCVYCGGPHDHDDHFIPLSKGGAHSISNLVPACQTCNISKNNRDPYEWMARKGYDFRP